MPRIKNEIKKRRQKKKINKKMEKGNKLKIQDEYEENKNLKKRFKC